MVAGGPQTRAINQRPTVAKVRIAGSPKLRDGSYELTGTSGVGNCRQIASVRFSDAQAARFSTVDHVTADGDRVRIDGLEILRRLRARL